jgi:hypothetical protein
VRDVLPAAADVGSVGYWNIDRDRGSDEVTSLLQDDGRHTLGDRRAGEEPDGLTGFESAIE